MKPDVFVGTTVEQAGKYFPEGFQGHGHLIVVDGKEQAAIIYDVRKSPPICVICNQGADNMEMEYGILQS